jgi:hypothetical protein
MREPPDSPPPTMPLTLKTRCTSCSPKGPDGAASEAVFVCCFYDAVQGDDAGATGFAAADDTLDSKDEVYLVLP